MAGLESRIRPSRSSSTIPVSALANVASKRASASHLVALGLELRGVRHGAGQNHRQQLHHGELALAEGSRLVAVEQQQADRLPGVQQRDRDDRAHAAAARQRRVDPLVVLGVQAEQ